MKINERLLKKLIKESLTQNLLFERASDEKYDTVINLLIEIIKNPKEYLHPHGRLEYKYNTFIKTSRGSIEADLDPRYTRTEYAKILNLVKQYFSLKRYVPGLASGEKIYWLDDIEEDFLNRFSKSKNKKNITFDIKPLYAFTIKSNLVNTLALKLHEELGGFNDFMKMSAILMLLENLKIVLYPTLETAGGSMSATGTFNISCGYYNQMFQKIRPLPKPPELPEAPSLPPRRTITQDLPPPRKRKPTMMEATVPPIPDTAGSVSDPRNMRQILMPAIEELNTYGYNKVMAVISWLYVEDKTFLEYLEKFDRATLISHEIGHYINAIRAAEKSGGPVHARDSGLKDYKTATVGTKGYQLSTEELQARYVELRTKIDSDIDKIINFNSVVDLTNKTLKEKQSIFLNGIDDVFQEASEADLYRKVISLLFNGQKSEAVNLVIKGTKRTISGPPGTNWPPTTFFDDNFIKAILLKAAGQDETIWQTKKGKQYLGRVYNRIVDLVDFIDDILEDNGLK